jgi:hypothetical protein
MRPSNGFLAVLLFRLTTTSGALDWVSIITAIAGLMLAVAGMYLIFHDKGGSTHTGPHPHTGS